MIRKAIIITSVVLAIATLVVGAASVKTDIMCCGKYNIHRILEGKSMWRVWFAEGSLRFSYSNERIPNVVVPPKVTLCFSRDWRYSGSEGRRPALRCDHPISKIDAIALQWRSEKHYYRDTDETVALDYTCRLAMPLWFPLVLFSIYPTIAFVRAPYRRRHLRRKKGLCIHCGYNLTGNVSGVCPECGEKV